MLYSEIIAVCSEIHTKHIHERFVVHQVTSGLETQTCFFCPSKQVGITEKDRNITV